MTLTTSLVHISTALLLLMADMAAATAAESRTYEVPLPEQITTAPDLCAYAPCREVMPGADSFSTRKGKPPFVEAYKRAGNEQQLLGYLFLSTDIVALPGYSGKPIVTLIGMDSTGHLTGVKILRHGESILRAGIPEEKVNRFIGQYVGKYVGDTLVLGNSRDPSDTELDAISGATVTTVIEHQVIVRSAIAIARQVGILEPPHRVQAAFADIEQRLRWDEMVRERSIERLTVTPGEVGAAGNDDYIDIHFGYLNVPALGKSILGDSGYDNLMSRLQPGEQAIFIIADGMASFKGSGFARGGIYERIQVSQGLDTFTFRDTDYLNLYGIEAESAPAYRESGIFIIRDSSFCSTSPWQLVFLASKSDPATGTRTFRRFAREYRLPARYIEGGRPVVERPEPDRSSARNYPSSAILIIIFTLLMLVIYVLYRSNNRDR